MSNGSEERGDAQGLAPVIPLFGARSAGPLPITSSQRHPARGITPDADAGRPADVRPHLRAVARHEPAVARAAGDESAGGLAASGDDAAGDDPEELRVAAEEILVRKLRSRSLSVAEATTVLKGTGLDADQIDEIIDRFCHRGYLDDRVLADLLVTSGTQRKGQGRIALGRALAQRGLSRDVIDEAMAALPDDDEERALEYARSKASSMARLDFDTALRRLVGQLARRGYTGSVAMTAARTALKEFIPGRTASGVRFVDSD